MKCVCNEKIVLAEQVEQAFSLMKRMKGLMGRPFLPVGAGLLLKPCPQIHTCFMRFAIDVLFLDKQGKVVHIIENMPPWRFSPIVARAAQTLELPSGVLQGQVKVGDQLRFE